MGVAEVEELKRLPFIIDQLEAIQELHVPALGWGVPLRCGHCAHEHPCPTRRLADDALGGGGNG